MRIEKDSNEITSVAYLEANDLYDPVETVMKMRGIKISKVFIPLDAKEHYEACEVKQVIDGTISVGDMQVGEVVFYQPE